MARGSAIGVLGATLRLGLTSFGGPVAHIGYQREAFVARLRWLDDDAFAELVALCQTLPGPASSQLTAAVGAIRGGWAGAWAAWIGFTLPSFLLMTAVGLVVASGGLPDTGPQAGLVAGFQVAAVAVVAQAVLAMARRLTPDARRIAVAGAVAALSLAVPSPWTQVAAIAAGAAFGAVFLRDLAAANGGGLPDGPPLPSPVTHRGSVVLVSVVLALLFGLPVAATVTGSDAIAFIGALVRAGALVFGGGHVVLPLLDATVVGPGWVSPDAFLAGYGVAQAVPGPLFSFAAYLGAVSTAGPGGVAGAALATVAIFLPGVLLVLAALPALGWLRSRPDARAALAGVNAAVVGILAAALLVPVAATAIRGPLEAVLAAAGAALLITGRVPPLAVVLGTALVMAAARLP